MLIKGLDECDAVNYKKLSMFIAFPTCTLKCDKLNGMPVCQNCRLLQAPDIEISKEEICERYLSNGLTEAFVFGGLEPFDSDLALSSLVDCIRNKYHINDDIVIYTGYTKKELELGWRDCDHNVASVYSSFWNSLKSYPNIIVKFGRYMAHQPPRYDPILGVSLASDNQYAEVISNALVN